MRCAYGPSRGVEVDGSTTTLRPLEARRAAVRACRTALVTSSGAIGSENCGRVGAPPAVPRCYRPGRAPTCGNAMAMPWAGAVTDPRRARLLVSGAATAAVATAVLLALLTAALVAGWGGGPAAGYGSAAFGAAGLAVGLLVLARAGAVARTDAARGRALCNRYSVWALFAVLPVFIVGGVAGYLTRAAAPIWGSTVAGILLIALVGLAARQRVVLEVRAAW